LPFVIKYVLNNTALLIYLYHRYCVKQIESLLGILHYYLLHKTGETGRSNMSTAQCLYLYIIITFDIPIGYIIMILMVTVPDIMYTNTQYLLIDRINLK